MSTGKKKRSRATVIAQKSDRVLVVRERDADRFGLPGGGIKGWESVMEAALRELREETGLRPFKAERLFDHEGATQIHKVVSVQVRGRVKLQQKELDDYRWWDRDESIPVFPTSTLSSTDTRAADRLRRSGSAFAQADA